MPGMSAPRSAARLAITLLASAVSALSAAAPASAGALPAECVHEQRTATGAVVPSGLCVSLGYGYRPASMPTAPATRNVFEHARNREPLPADLYVRSDVAEQIAAGSAKPRATYVLFAGGAFMCGSRADVATQAREIARRGYVAIAAEYPLMATIPEYANYRPVPDYRQGQITTVGANSCDAFDTWTTTPLWQRTVLPRFKAKGLEPALAEAQRTSQSLVRTVRKGAADLGVDPKRIFAIGWSAGGSVALRLALAGDDDAYLHRGIDPGDSSIAGAVSISGPACYPGSKKVTAPMLAGQLRPSDSPACRFSASPGDPTVVMIQEPRGGANDRYIPSELMLGGCNAINAVARGRCIYEDRAPSKGGYVADGNHAYLASVDFRRLLDVLASGGVGAP